MRRNSQKSNLDCNIWCKNSDGGVTLSISRGALFPYFQGDKLDPLCSYIRHNVPFENVLGKESLLLFFRAGFQNEQDYLAVELMQDFCFRIADF